MFLKMVYKTPLWSLPVGTYKILTVELLAMGWDWWVHNPVHRFIFGQTPFGLWKDGRIQVC
jgi:hypothetical protein